MEVGEEEDYNYTYRYTHYQNYSCIKMGSDESHFNVSFIVRDSVHKPYEPFWIYITLSDSHTYIFTIHRCRVKHSWSFTIRKYHFKTSQCKPISKLNLQKSVHFHLHVLDACKIIAYYSLLWCDVYSLSLSHISPHLTYASTVWDSCSGILFNKVNYLHSRRAAKLMISDSSLTTANTKLQVLGLVPLKEKLMFNKAVLVFKAHTNLVPPYLKQLFCCCNPRATSRFITLPKPRLDLF